MGPEAYFSYNVLVWWIVCKRCHFFLQIYEAVKWLMGQITFFKQNVSRINKDYNFMFNYIFYSHFILLFIS